MIVGARRERRQTNSGATQEIRNKEHSRDRQAAPCQCYRDAERRFSAVAFPIRPLTVCSIAWACLNIETASSLKEHPVFKLDRRAPHRPTRDIDLLVYGPPVMETLPKVFNELCDVEVIPEGLTFQEESVAPK